MPSTSAGLFRNLRPRDPAEPHRVATPLELLTDLCFVVAIAQAAAQLHHAISGGHVELGLLGYAMAFFAIWWTWLNFSWFASAYDNDDVAYRLLTILQIVGSLIIAAGIPAVFEEDFTVVVIGYLVMRVALVIQWSRAARHDPRNAVTCRRYAIGIVVAQLCWLTILVMPLRWIPIAFLLFVVLELAVPIFAERAGRTQWHPHHIAERYALFFIIVLGEVILSTLASIQQAFAAAAGTEELTTPWSVLIVAVSGVGIVFSLWWLYFSRSAGPILERAHDSPVTPFVWGFGHYFLFAGTAAIGAALGARVDHWGHTENVPVIASAAMINGAVALVLTMIWFLHLRHHQQSWRTAIPFGLAIIALLAAIFTPYPELFAAGICILLLIVEVRFAGLAR